MNIYKIGVLNVQTFLKVYFANFKDLIKLYQSFIFANFKVLIKLYQSFILRH